MAQTQKHREYLDITIPLNLKGSGKSLVAVDSVRVEANLIIRDWIESYRAEGWTPEGGVDLLSAYRDRRVLSKIGFFGRITFVSVSFTLHRDVTG